MLRMLALVVLGNSSIAMAQVPPAEPTPAETAASAEAIPPSEPAEAAEPTEPAEPAEPAEVEEAPKMKKVCRSVEVVGSAIGRTVCTMKPIRPKPKAD